MTPEQQRFIESIAGYAKKYAPSYGIRVISPIIAQAINESGWGTSDLGKRHNYFGLKCRSNWSGPYVEKVTQEEYTPGKISSIIDRFRAYPDMESGVRGYFEFLFDPIVRGAYGNLVGVTDPVRYLQLIKEDGYCTRSNYVQALARLISEFDLTRFDVLEGGGVEIIRKIVAPGHGTFAPPNPIYFAVHSTAEPGASAYNHTVYWSRPKAQQGGKEYAVHLVSDWKEAYQCVEFDHVCWQVGNGNRTCIGLEICEATNQTDFIKGLEIARDVILQMLARYGWTVDKNVRSHKWFTENYGGSDHIDPIPYFQRFGWTWDKFISFLKEGEDVMTPEDIKKIADAVWSHDNHGWEAEQVYKEVTRTDDPTGRGKLGTTHVRVNQLAPVLQEINSRLSRLEEKVG